MNYDIVAEFLSKSKDTGSGGKRQIYYTREESVGNKVADVNGMADEMVLNAKCEFLRELLYGIDVVPFSMKKVDSFLDVYKLSCASRSGDEIEITQPFSEYFYTSLRGDDKQMTCVFLPWIFRNDNRESDTYDKLLTNNDVEVRGHVFTDDGGIFMFTGYNDRMKPVVSPYDRVPVGDGFGNLRFEVCYYNSETVSAIRNAEFDSSDSSVLGIRNIQTNLCSERPFFDQWFRSTIAEAGIFPDKEYSFACDSKVDLIEHANSFYRDARTFMETKVNDEIFAK